MLVAKHYVDSPSLPPIESIILGISAAKHAGLPLVLIAFAMSTKVSTTVSSITACYTLRNVTDVLLQSRSSWLRGSEVAKPRPGIQNAT
jgi:hypothetical protein